jgi:hypothetical protein
MGEQRLKRGRCFFCALSHGQASYRLALTRKVGMRQPTRKKRGIGRLARLLLLAHFGKKPECVGLAITSWQQCELSFFFFRNDADFDPLL